jgi:hypothetical protein
VIRKKTKDAIARNKKNELVLGAKITIAITNIVKIKEMDRATCLEEILFIFNIFTGTKLEKYCYTLINSNFMVS